jgi:hypothetical protein
MNDPAPVKSENPPLPLFRLPTGTVINLRLVAAVGWVRPSRPSRPSFFPVFMLGVQPPFELESPTMGSLDELRDELLIAWYGVMGGTQ